MPTTKMSQNDKQKSSKGSKCRDSDQTRVKEIDGQMAEIVHDESSSDSCDDCGDCAKNLCCPRISPCSVMAVDFGIMCHVRMYGRRCMHFSVT